MRPVPTRRTPPRSSDATGAHAVMESRCYDPGFGALSSPASSSPSRTHAPQHSSTSAPSHRRTPAQPHRKGQAYNVQEEGRWDGAASPSSTRVQDTDADTRGARVSTPCPVRQSDLAELRARPGQPPWRSAYRALLGGDQPRCTAGDTVTAGAMVRKIEEAIAHGGWTANERGRLYRMRDRWRRRAQGLDPRFLLAGTRPGRLSHPDVLRLRALERSATL